MTLSTVEVKTVIAQLKRREGLTVSKLAKKIDVDFGELNGYLYRGVHMEPDKHNRLISFLKVRLERYGRTSHPLLTDSAELHKSEGWGVRAGTSNAPDPDLPMIAERLRSIHDSGVPYRTLASVIGVSPEMLGRVTLGNCKRVYPENKAKLMAWYKSQHVRDDDEPTEDRDQLGQAALNHTWAEDRLNPLPSGVSTVGPVYSDNGRSERSSPHFDFDPELNAIRTCLEAIRDLPSGAQIRVLSYCTERAGAPS